VIVAAASPVLGLDWSWIGYTLGLALGVLTVITLRMTVRHGDPIAGWCLALVGIVATVWVTISTRSARVVPLLDPTTPGRVLKCYTDSGLDWSSDCGREYADRVVTGMVPAAAVAIVLATWLVLFRRHAHGVNPRGAPSRAPQHAPVRGASPTNEKDE
jgi:hypothetical protein